MTLPTFGNFIGGAFVSAQDEIPVLDPARGEQLMAIPRSQAADVQAAVDAATSTSWGSAGIAERADLLDAIADGIEADFDRFALLESLDTGKPVSLTSAIDIPRAIANFRFFAGAVRHQETGCHPMDSAINYTVRRPVGTFGLITPWNLPLYLLSWKLAPCLGMGNTAIAKPSELTPLSASALAEVFQRVGAPAGVYNVVHGFGHEVGQAIVEHPDIKGMSFTGGTATGKLVAKTAAPMFKKLSLELGGKNATIVFDDADLDETVAGTVRASFANQGQICLCGSRLLVQRGIYDQFMERFLAAVAELRPANPQDPSTRFGSLVSTGHREKVESYIALAKEEGGTIACGGVRPAMDAQFDGGAFLEPTVITGLAPDCRTATEEIFGPVITVHPFDTEEEAIAIANGVRYGLAGSVWTSDLKRGHRVAHAIESGMIWVNTWLLRDLRVPFGGMKDSGVGREGGRFSLEFYSESRNICIKL